MFGIPHIEKRAVLEITNDALQPPLDIKFERYDDAVAFMRAFNISVRNTKDTQAGYFVEDACPELSNYARRGSIFASLYIQFLARHGEKIRMPHATVKRLSL